MCGKSHRARCKGDESVRSIRTAFHLGKMEGEGKTKGTLQRNKMSMDTKSSTGSEGANGLRY